MVWVSSKGGTFFPCYFITLLYTLLLIQLLFFHLVCISILFYLFYFLFLLRFTGQINTFCRFVFSLSLFLSLSLSPLQHWNSVFLNEIQFAKILCEMGHWESATFNPFSGRLERSSEPSVLWFKSTLHVTYSIYLSFSLSLSLFLSFSFSLSFSLSVFLPSFCLKFSTT